jgi:hypothetical protein
MGLRHGAKQLTEQIEALENQGFELMKLSRQRVKYNPDFAIEKNLEAEECFRKARKLREEKLPDMLQRAAPPIEARLKELEDWRAEIEAGNVIRFKREA